MTQMKELANNESRFGSTGQIPDEDLETVTGGLTRPLDPDGYENDGVGGRSDPGHDDATEA